MNYNYYEAFRKYFEPLMNAPSPKTDALIESGFQQKSGGYIAYAKSLGMDVDFKRAVPRQGWHFICSYLDRTEPEKARIDRVVCGELVFWLAEMCHALTDTELDSLASQAKLLPRRQANTLIRERCFFRIVDVVMNSEEGKLDPRKKSAEFLNGYAASRFSV